METHRHFHPSFRPFAARIDRLAAIAVLLCSLGLPGTAHAATRYVGPAATGNGSGVDRNNLKSLSSAMTSARPGDVFLLQPGSYGGITFPNAGYGSAAGGYVIYRADPDTCAPRASDWFNGQLARATPDNNPVFASLSFADDYLADGKAKAKYIEIDGICVVNSGIVLRNHAAHVRVRNCSLWGKIPDDPTYHYANDRTGDGILWAPNYSNTGSDFNNITVDRCYFDFMQEGIDFQGNCTGNITISNCHVRDTAGAPLSARPWNIMGTIQVIGNHLERQLLLPWSSDSQTGYTVAAPNANSPNMAFTYQGAAPPSATYRFWVRIDDVSRGVWELRPIASMDNTSVKLAAPLSFNVEPGDKITFHGITHGSGIAIWGPNVTVRGNYVHNCGSTSGIFLYQKGLQNITIENNLVYDILNQYAVMLGEPGNGYSYGNNLRVVNNTFIGRRAPEYQSVPERTYGFALHLLAAPDTDPSTVTICNNLLVGQSWTAPAGATVRGNVLYAGTGYETDAVGPNQGNRVYYNGQAYPYQPRPFEGSGKYFIGGPTFDTYAFSGSPHGQNFNDGSFIPVAGSDPVGFAYPAAATTTDITGQTREPTLDTGCYQSTAVVSGDRPPMLSIIGDRQITTGETLTITINATGGSGPLTYSASNLPAGATFSGQTFTWTPGATQAGTYQVTFAVSDGQARDSQTITITVIKENSAPVLGMIGNKSVDENQALTFTISATDADSDPILYTASSLPTGASLTGSTFSWTPTYNQAGSYNVTFSASDGQAQDFQTITISVANVDRPPVMTDVGSMTVNPDQPLSFTLSATDPDGDALTYSAGALPSGATFIDQTFAWTPTIAQAGDSYTVTFEVSDGTLSSSGNATIIVPASNVAPVLATIGNQSVNENQTLMFTLDATDPDSSAITYAAANLPSGASLIGPTFSWTPTYNQAGSYNVTFTASDGEAQDTQTVAITVANVDRSPVLADIGNQSVEVRHSLSFALSATDPDGDDLTYSADALPGGATFSGQTFAWTPTSSQVGSYTVTFTVSDGTLTDSKTAVLTVEANAQDQIVPVVDQCSPAPDDIQVRLNNLVSLHIADANSGVDANTVAIRVNGSLVYQGNTDVYTSAYGRCSRTGAKNDYQFIYQSDALFDFDQTITVRVNAADLAGNAMNEYAYSFTTEMRAFSTNRAVSIPGGYTDSRPVTVCAPDGTMWVAWQTGTPGSRDIYVAKQPADSNAFEASMQITSDGHDQCNPALAINAAGDVYLVWQDNRNGNWDLYASICSNGVVFGKETRITTSNHNETSATIAIDHQVPARVYLAWQDDRNGNQDIYVASSADAFATSMVTRVTDETAEQKEPALAIGSDNVAYLFWTDLRNGQADIYAAASNADGNGGAWANLPVVTDPGDQARPAVAAGANATLHLLWVDNRNGNSDIYYATWNGLLKGPAVGVNIIDDTSGADQNTPVIVCSADQKVFACWQDARHAGGTSSDTDLYLTELRSGTAGTNVFVGDDGSNADQSEPALGVDRYGQPYVVWTDNRMGTTEIYCATATILDPTPLDSKIVTAAAETTVGTDPAAIKRPEDVSLVVPAGACQMDVRMTISRILHPQISSVILLGSYDFAPSGIEFGRPVTVTIPYAVAANKRRVIPYWYDSVTGALSQQGITDVENIDISPKLNALRFRTTHFTPYYLVAADPESTGSTGSGGGGGGGGGCAISSTGEGSPGEVLVPYLVIALIMVILRKRDRRNRAARGAEGS